MAPTVKEKATDSPQWYWVHKPWLPETRNPQWQHRPQPISPCYQQRPDWHSRQCCVQPSKRPQCYSSPHMPKKTDKAILQHPRVSYTNEVSFPHSNNICTEAWEFTLTSAHICWDSPVPQYSHWQGLESSWLIILSHCLQQSQNPLV